MVIPFIHLLMLLPCLVFSTEFTASVNKTEVNSGEGFLLNLTLKDASPKAPPTSENLKSSFIIHSQQQSSSTVINNGKMSSSLIWTFSLLPQVTGEIEIPSISIETSEGTLFSQPIKMQIHKKEKSTEDQTKEDIYVEIKTNKVNPYKNEPFFLTARLVSRKNLANVQAEKFDIEGAIVESAGNPMITERIENGIKQGIVEFNYLITPLKPGFLIIPPITIQGTMPQRRNSQSLLDDSFDHFPLIQGLVNLQPFALSTKEQKIEIRTPLQHVNPWLPAKALNIQESLELPQEIHAGESFTRSFVITAEGIHSSQLPNLEGMQNTKNEFKIYTDKPELKDEIHNGQLKSYRIEKYTLIPQKSGEITLPPISINWWNTEKEEKQETSIDPHLLKVLPELNVSSNETQEIALLNEHKTTHQQFSTIQTTIPLILYILIGSLVIALLIAISGLFFLQKKIRKLLPIPENQPQKKSKPISFQNLSTTNQTPSKKSQDKLGDLNPT
jgi:hypothetical protein